MLRRVVLPLLAMAWIAGIAIAGLRGGRPVDDARVPLPIERAYPHGFGARIQLRVECATDVEVVIGKDHGGSELPEITVWGRPKVGRCHPEEAAIGSTPKVGPKFVDGATSQVVEIT